MKIRLDDVMQSVSCPFRASYYYYIPLETVLMFMNGVIYGKSIDGISSEKDILRQKEDFIKLPEIGEEGREKVMMSFISSLGDEAAKVRLREAAEKGIEYFDSILTEERLLIRWINFRDDIYMEFSRRWSRDNGLELIE
jgi:hypothetical protein